MPNAQPRKGGRDLVPVTQSLKGRITPPLFFHIIKGGDLYMEVNDILTAISTVGFPIVACIALYYQNLKTTKALSDLTSAITELKVYMERKNNE